VRLHLGDVLLRNGEAGDEDLHFLLVEHGKVGHDHLREGREKVDGKRLRRERLRLPDLVAQVVGRKRRSAHDAEATGVRHRRHERGHRHASHPGEDDRVLDTEQVADGCAQHRTLTCDR